MIFICFSQGSCSCFTLNKFHFHNIRHKSNFGSCIYYDGAYKFNKEQKPPPALPPAPCMPHLKPPFCLASSPPSTSPPAPFLPHLQPCTCLTSSPPPALNAAPNLPPCKPHACITSIQWLKPSTGARRSLCTLNSGYSKIIKNDNISVTYISAMTEIVKYQRNM